MLLYPINCQNRTAMCKLLRDNRLQPLLTVDWWQNHIISEHMTLLQCLGLLRHSFTAGTEAPCRHLLATCADWYSALCAVKNISVNSYFLARAFTPLLICRIVVTQWPLVPWVTFSECDRLPIFFHCMGVRCALSMSARESLLETHISLGMVSTTQICLVLS